MSSHLPEFGSAPIEYCPVLSELACRPLYLMREDYSDEIGSGNKVRKLHALAPYLARLSVTDIILDGTSQSNSCMSVAHYAPSLGIRAHLILTGDKTPTENHHIMINSGADIRYMGTWDPDEIQKHRLDLRDAIIHAGGVVYDAPTGLTDENTVTAGCDIAKEIALFESDSTQAGVDFQDIYVACGTGGTAAGISWQDAAQHAPSRVRGVLVANDIQFYEDATKGLYDSLGDVTRSMPFFDDTQLGGGYEQNTPEQLTLQKKLVKQGLFFDTVYMLKTVSAALEHSVRESRRGAGLIIHTGGSNQAKILR